MEEDNLVPSRVLLLISLTQHGNLGLIMVEYQIPLGQWSYLISFRGKSEDASDTEEPCVVRMLTFLPGLVCWPTSVSIFQSFGCQKYVQTKSLYCRPKYRKIWKTGFLGAGKPESGVHRKLSPTFHKLSVVTHIIGEEAMYMKWEASLVLFKYRYS